MKIFFFEDDLSHLHMGRIQHATGPEKPTTTPIPVQLSAPEFHLFIWVRFPIPQHDGLLRYLKLATGSFDGGFDLYSEWHDWILISDGSYIRNHEPHASPLRVARRYRHDRIVSSR